MQCYGGDGQSKTCVALVTDRKEREREERKRRRRGYG